MGRSNTGDDGLERDLLEIEPLWDRNSKRSYLLDQRQRFGDKRDATAAYKLEVPRRSMDAIMHVHSMKCGHAILGLATV